MARREGTKESKGPKVTPEDVRKLVAALNNEEDWIDAEELTKRTGMSDRKVRKAANVASPKVISYPGSPGYKLFENCSVEEIRHAIASFTSQGKDMIRRANVILIAFHRMTAAPLSPVKPVQLELLPS